MRVTNMYCLPETELIKIVNFLSSKLLRFCETTVLSLCEECPTEVLCSDMILEKKSCSKSNKNQFLLPYLHYSKPMSHGS